MSKTISCNSQFEEMIEKTKVDTVFSVVLRKGGSTHNIVVREKGNQNLFGNIALERIIAMYDVKNKPKCEFGFYENVQQLERNKEINVIEATRVFICLPRIVIIPYDNIGLLEEGPFPFLESANSTGNEVKIDDKIILDKFPSFKPYYSSEVGGFFQSPVLIKSSGNVVQFPQDQPIRDKKIIDAVVTKEINEAKAKQAEHKGTEEKDEKDE